MAFIRAWAAVGGMAFLLLAAVVGGRADETKPRAAGDAIAFTESDWLWWRGPDRNGVARPGQSPPLECRVAGPVAGAVAAGVAGPVVGREDGRLWRWRGTSPWRICPARPCSTFG